MKNPCMTVAFVLCSTIFFQTPGLADQASAPRESRTLGATRVACDPQVNIAWDGNPVPSSFDAEAVSFYRNMVHTWVEAYEAKVEGANNSLVSDLSQSSQSCLGAAQAVELESPLALKTALKDCVFTSINAYSGPAVSPENQDALAEAFVQAHDEQLRFRKLVNASLQFDPIEAFNTKCVLEVRNQKYPDYRLYLAGYTID